MCSSRFDGNLRYQQNLAQSKITVVVLSAPNNKLETLKPLMGRVFTALNTIETGQGIVLRIE